MTVLLMASRQSCLCTTVVVALLLSHSCSGFFFKNFWMSFPFMSVPPRHEMLQQDQKKIADLVTPFGYPLEQHTVKTDDGYLLGMYRLPYGRSGEGGGATARPAVLLQHGLLDSCASYLMNGPGKALAFILADAGYDVWLGNARGNTYSRAHVWMDTESAAFWAFSWDEVAKYDLPAMVRHVRAAAGVATLGYVGHSQGGTSMIAALSSQPELRAVISVAALMAPVAYAKHFKSVPILAMAALGQPQERLFALLGIHEFMPSDAILAQLEGSLCTVGPALCMNVITAICGYNPDNIDQSRLPLYLQYTPAGTSVQNMVHWCQMVQQPSSHTMSWYDYGTACWDMFLQHKKCNQHMYGQDVPPVYDLSKIHTPIALFDGGKDDLADPLDIENLVEALPGGTIVLRHSEPDYSHLDFMCGINAHERIYDKLVTVFNQSVVSVEKAAGRRRRRATQLA